MTHTSKIIAERAKNTLQKLDKILTGEIKFNFIFAFLLLTVSVLHCQNYTYRTYLNDSEIAGTIKDNFTSDTIQKYISQFHDRLGYHYYLYQSVLKNPEDRRVAVQYLDTAFARGLDYLCLAPLIKQMFGDSIINRSHSLNYLKAYDLKLKQRLDSLKEEDQKYRRLAFPNGKRVQLSDSITALWKLIDSSNVIFLKALIKKDGYPTARKIGYDFCTYKRANPEIIIQHLGLKERDFQIALTKQEVELCLKNEEDWRKIDGLQFNLHNRFSYSYSEFTFLYFMGEKIDVEKSLFSLRVMAGILQSPFKTMYIKCGSERVFKDLKGSLVKLNRSLPLPPKMEELIKFGVAPLKKVEENQIVFVMDKSVPEDKVYYKIVD